MNSGQSCSKYLETEKNIHAFCNWCDLVWNVFPESYTAWKVSKHGIFSGPYFLTFGLNTERYEISLRIQSECRNIRTRKNSVFGHFWHSVILKSLLLVYNGTLWLSACCTVKSRLVQHCKWAKRGFLNGNYILVSYILRMIVLKFMTLSSVLEGFGMFAECFFK